MDASFWALVALVLFFALIMYIKVPGFVTKALDDRSDKIRGDLEEARRLREEAQQLLAEMQRMLENLRNAKRTRVLQVLEEAYGLARVKESIDSGVFTAYDTPLLSSISSNFGSPS